MTGQRLQLQIGVVVERRRATSPWLDYVWSPVAALSDGSDAPVWTKLSEDENRAWFFCGNVEIVLYGTETSNYLENLGSAAPSIWVVLRPTDSEPPYTLIAATVDPAEGEGLTQAGTDLVGVIPIPITLQEVIAAFIEVNPVRQNSYKRKRDETALEADGAYDHPKKARQ